MTVPLRQTTVLDSRPLHRRFRRDVLRGLSRRPKRLPSKYFYDARGSRLFDEICQLPEYYLTRTELQLMQATAPEIADVIGANAIIIEYGSGSSLKSRLLLDALDQPRAYLPVDISFEHLQRAADAIAEEFPNLDVRPISADFTRPFDLPDEVAKTEHRTVYFPGSTIGNFTSRRALHLLRRIRRQCGDDGGLLLGIDLVKDESVLHAAYNDSAGVTAAFNLNLLRRINRELNADFDLDAFRHDAVWNQNKSRIEMHLRSRCDQSVLIGQDEFEFTRGESICTEFSHKYTQSRLHYMASHSGFDVQQVWTDANKWFGVAYLKAQ